MRSALGVALALIAAAAVVVGGTCLYVRQELLNSHAFADRTVAALGHEAVRRVVSREIVVQVIDQGSSDLIAARPIITSVVDTVVATQQFRGLIRLAADQGHRLLFDRGGNVAFSLADAGTVVISALRTLAPNIARKVSPDVDARLLDLRRQSFAVRTLRAADRIRTLGIVLPLLALALLALAVAMAPRRRWAIARCALTLAVAGVAMFVDLALLRHSILVNLFGSEELSNADVRAAAGSLWDAYLGDLSTWALALAALGAIVAATSANVLRPYAAVARLAPLRARAWPPHTRLRRALTGGAALVLGLLLIAEPTLVLDIVVACGGALLAYLGTGELLTAVGVAPEHERLSLSRSRGAIAAIAASLGVLIGGAAIALGVAAPPSRARRWSGS